MRQKVKEQEVEQLYEELEYKPGNDTTCKHYWLIESATGHKSRGVCKLCGAEKEFLNSVPDYNGVKPAASFMEIPGIKDISFGDELEEAEV
ncbi:hypothetical protein ACFLUB_03815 [Chloroflexota bacterium]